ncbi:MAG: hypothetical protein QOC77_3767 [Thermoleophilaceae bacterium]|nr:hypothetical protein [Thermoleophilaceae bacterium]MEA2469692.1 hypothetical protein [Thermoleophilaceae bacterium]
MAEEKEESAGKTKSPAESPRNTRIPFIVGGVLIALFVAAGIASKKSTPKPYNVEGSRAVVLPAADRQRSVVVPPCSPPTVITPQNAATQIQVQGAVAVAVPKGAPQRTVVIPRCSAKAAPSPGGTNIPSAAFVLGPGFTVSNVSKVPKGGDPVAFGIKNQVTIPAGSPATTIVAAPCQGTAKAEKTTVLKPSAGSGGVAIAPGC